MARPLSRPDRKVLWIIGILVMARLATSAVMGLGMDESYSTAISRDLHLSYFDHPPMHQWIAHAAGQVLGYGHWVRLPFIALFAGSTWLMYRLTARLFGQDAGVLAEKARCQPVHQPGRSGEERDEREPHPVAVAQHLPCRVGDPLMHGRMVEIGQVQIAGDGGGVGLVHPKPHHRRGRQPRHHQDADDPQDLPVRTGQRAGHPQAAFGDGFALDTFTGLAPRTLMGLGGLGWPMKRRKATQAAMPNAPRQIHHSCHRLKLMAPISR